MTSAVVPGPVGAALDTQERAGLLDVLTLLDGQGVHMLADFALEDITILGADGAPACAWAASS